MHGKIMIKEKLPAGYQSKADDPTIGMFVNASRVITIAIQYFLRPVSRVSGDACYGNSINFPQFFSPLLINTSSLIRRFYRSGEHGTVREFLITGNLIYPRCISPND